MERKQAIALLGALMATETKGGDNEGNEYTEERNAHFLGALRVAFPDMPYTHVLKTHYLEPIPVDALNSKLLITRTARESFALFLAEWAACLSNHGDNK